MEKNKEDVRQENENHFPIRYTILISDTDKILYNLFDW